MNTVIVIQARMGSTRLPGKVLMTLNHHPVLEWCVRACQAAPNADVVMVATSTLDADDAIDQWCERNGIHCWRGSETDVLSRYIGAARVAHADIILRITGDEPFVDPRVIAEVIELQKRTGADYVSNCHPRTYPDGLDVECFTREALEAAHAEATRQVDRDTVTYWITRNRSRFPAEAVINPVGDMSKERWVLDTERDLKFCVAVAQYWTWSKGPPSMLDIKGVLDRDPELRKINPGVMNERFYEALAQEDIVPRRYGRSQAQLQRAQTTIPTAAQTFSKSYLQFAQPSPLFLSHGQGTLVYDVDGNEYVDLVSALLPNVLGYRDTDVDQAIRRQLSAGISFSLATELETRLSEILCRLIPCAEMVRFGKTGTDVTTAAIRLARAYTRRDKVLICGGYHGWADWSVERDLGVPVEVQDTTTRIPFGHPPDPVHPKVRYAAVIVEPDRDPLYLQSLREFCDRTDAVLIFDEVITGFRYALGGAQEHWGITPDLACFGKAMANGMPLSALVGKRELMERMAPPNNIFYSGTFFGETLSLAAGIATIEKMERDRACATLSSVGEFLRTDAEETIEGFGLEDHIELHGHPSFTRLKFSDDDVAALFRREMINSGTLIIASHNVCTAMGLSEIERVGNSYEHACRIVADAIKKGDLKERLAGGSIAKGIR